ncbi:hypothetical protein V8F06_001864 [Rhypophila decipiens]
MRNYIRHALSVPSKNSWAYEVEGDIGFHRFEQDEQALTLWVHETGHSIDSQMGPDKRTWFTGTQPWLTAYNSDSAVSGVYARVSQRENFAQELNIALLDRNFPGGMNSTNQTQWLQVGHQVRAIQARLGNILLPGGKCDIDARGKYPGISDIIVCLPNATNCLAFTNATYAKEHGHDPNPNPIPTQSPQGGFPGPQGGQRGGGSGGGSQYLVHQRRRCSRPPPPPPPPPPPRPRPDYGPGTPTYQNNTISNGKPDPDANPSPSPNPDDGTIRQITWRNVPINNSAAAIAAQYDKVPLPDDCPNRKFSFDSGFGYFGLSGHGLGAGVGVGCTPA